MNLKIEEVIGVIIAGVLAGALLAWIERTWPTVGVTRL